MLLCASSAHDTGTSPSTSLSLAPLAPWINLKTKRISSENTIGKKKLRNGAALMMRPPVAPGPPPPPQDNSTSSKAMRLFRISHETTSCSTMVPSIPISDRDPSSPCSLMANPLSLTMPNLSLTSATLSVAQSVLSYANKPSATTRSAASSAWRDCHNRYRFGTM